MQGEFLTLGQLPAFWSALVTAGVALGIGLLVYCLGPLEPRP
jgi:hypothetical protein